MSLVLRDLAHARSGDKGNHSNINIWVYDPGDMARVRRSLDPERLRKAFPKLLKGPIVLHELSALGGFNLVLHDALEGGVNASLNLDGHGKSWSCLVLGLTVVD